jgi:hypothetical protein
MRELIFSCLYSTLAQRRMQIADVFGDELDRAEKEEEAQAPGDEANEEDGGRKRSGVGDQPGDEWGRRGADILDKALDGVGGRTYFWDRNIIQRR